MSSKASRHFSSGGSHQNSAPYQVLALIYDEVMAHVEYLRWARYIRRIINRYHRKPYAILDLGCGTGNFIAALGKLGLAADGCDPSAAMLKLAQKKNPDRTLWLDSLPALENSPSQYYSVMTCLYDSINYLMEPQILEDAFRRIYQLLPPGGLFIFDAVSEIFCQVYFNGFTEEEIVDGKFAYLRQSRYDTVAHHQINEFTIYTPDGIFEEHHVQAIYPFRQIRNIIKNNTEFRLLAVYEDFTFYKASEDSNRAHFVLQKPKS
ncbi:MAG: class I SAM-dependent methyltransferase [Calditrichia bacterium]